LERFVMFVIRVVILVAFVILTYRYALTAEASSAPWETLPLINKL
jgi:hypothetical protein